MEVRVRYVSDTHHHPKARVDTHAAGRALFISLRRVTWDDPDEVGEVGESLFRVGEVVGEATECLLVTPGS